MKFNEKGNAVFETTGRTFYTHGGIIGIGPDLRPYEGYDGHFGPSDRHSWSDEDEDPPLSPEELSELAAHMIGRWQDVLIAALAGKVQPWVPSEDDQPPVPPDRPDPISTGRMILQQVDISDDMMRFLAPNIVHFGGAKGGGKLYEIQFLELSEEQRKICLLRRDADRSLGRGDSSSDIKEQGPTT